MDSRQLPPNLPQLFLSVGFAFVTLLIGLLYLESEHLGGNATAISAAFLTPALAYGIRIYQLPRSLSKLETFYFLLLILACIGGGAGYAAGLLSIGRHHTLADERSLQQLRAQITSDTRFQNVELDASGKVLRIEGTVRFPRDVRTLRGLVDSHRMYRSYVFEVTAVK